LLEGLGPPLVQECGVRSGQRVLDVAAGTGVAALPAAATGARVTAVDITPELLAAGRAEAERLGLEVEWREGDAQDLPFAEGEFDVVLSSIGAMFAPDHQRTASELLRVCRPGGVVGMVNWTPGGSIGKFFRVFAPYSAPPPPDAPSPLAWGTPQYVAGLFGDRVSSLRIRPGVLPVDRFPDPAAFCAYYKQVFGPTIAAYAGIAGDPQRVAGLDRDFLAYAQRHNLAGPGESARYGYDYLLVVAVRAGR